MEMMISATKKNTAQEEREDRVQNTIERLQRSIEPHLFLCSFASAVG